MPSLRSLLACLVVLSVAGAAAARAEDAPPSRVGRVSAVEGAVSLRVGGGEWGDSAVNDPVASGMAVRAGERARVVLGIGAERIVLSGGSEIAIARLDDGVSQIVLRRGRIGVHLARLEPGDSVEIDLPRGALWLLSPGEVD